MKPNRGFACMRRMQGPDELAQSTRGNWFFDRCARDRRTLERSGGARHRACERSFGGRIRMRAHICLQARRGWVMNAENTKPQEVKIRVHDGIEIAVALYRPEGDDPHPVVLAASPYRYTTARCRRLHNFSSEKPARSNCMSNAAMSTHRWTCVAAASQAVSSVFWIAMNRKISTTSSNGSTASPGRTAKSAG